MRNFGQLEGQKGLPVRTCELTSADEPHSGSDEELIVSTALKYNLREKPFCIVVLGCSCVGKTTFIDNLFTRNVNANRNLPSTTPVILTSRIIAFPDEPYTHIRLSVFECNGSREGYSAAKRLCENADGYLLCYDCIDPSSFEALEDYVKLLTAKKKRSSVLIGLKQDLMDHERIIRASTVLAFQEDHNFCGSFEVSSFDENSQGFTPILRRLLRASEEDSNTLSTSLNSISSFRSRAPPPLLFHSKSGPIYDVDGGTVTITSIK